MGLHQHYNGIMKQVPVYKSGAGGGGLPGENKPFHSVNNFLAGYLSNSCFVHFAALRALSSWDGCCCLFVSISSPKV